MGSLNLHNSTLTLSVANSTLTDQGAFSADNTSFFFLSEPGRWHHDAALGSFSSAITNQTNFTASPATVQVIGPGQHTLEVAGLDLGPLAPGNGNFGFGSLVVGQSGPPATLELVDPVNIGDLAVGPEALYLFGSAGQNGLSLLDASTSCSTIRMPTTTLAAIGFHCKPSWAATKSCPSTAATLPSKPARAFHHGPPGRRPRLHALYSAEKNGIEKDRRPPLDGTRFVCDTAR